VNTRLAPYSSLRRPAAHADEPSRGGSPCTASQAIEGPLRPGRAGCRLCGHGRGDQGCQAFPVVGCVEDLAQARLGGDELGGDGRSADLEGGPGPVSPKAADSYYEALYVTALGTGARQGELLGLMWADVDFEARTIRIRQTLQRGTRTVAEPKTAGSRRTLSLAPCVVTVLRGIKDAHRAAGRPIPGPGSFVFALPNGRPFDSVNVTHALADALARAKLPRQRFHDLRHAFATLQLEAGADFYSVSRALGQTGIATTADTYAHWTEAMNQSTADRAESFLADLG